MTRKILYLINPISGTKSKKNIRQVIEQQTKQQQIAYEIANTNPQGNYNNIIDEIEQKRITDVVIVGGDGTVNQVINALQFCDVNFGIVPVGSGNGLARSAGIAINVKIALQQIFKGHATYVDAFMVNNYFSCMLSGVGFDAEVAYQFSTKSKRGLLTYTQQSIINYYKAHPFLFEVILPEYNFFTDAFFISIANSNQFGNNITIAPKARLNDALLDVVIVQKMSKTTLPFAILKQLRGDNKLQEITQKLTEKNIIYFQTPQLTIKNMKQAPLHIDGDPKETQDVLNIKILPNCYRLLH